MLAIVADLAPAEDVERDRRARSTDAFGQIDILINCAGSAMGGRSSSCPIRAYLDAWTLKLLGLHPHDARGRAGR